MDAPIPERPAARERGGALIAALFVLFLAVGMSTACLLSAPLTVKDANERVGRARARYLAMGAVAKARASLGQGVVTGLVTMVGGLLGTQQILSGVIDAQPITLLHSVQAAPDETAAAMTTRQSDGSYLITAYAKAQGLTQGVVYVVGGSTASPFQWASFGGSGIQLDGAISTDSYSSALGAYSLQAALGLGTYGTIASNSSIYLAGGTVRGNATPGPGGSVSKGGATVTGSIVPASATVPIAPVRITAPATTDNAALGARIAADGSLTASSGTVQLPAGTYQLSGLTASSSGVVEVTGDVTLYLSGPLVITNSATIKVDAQGSLKVYTSAPVSVGGGGFVNLTGATAVLSLLQSTTDGNPAKLEIFVAPDAAGHGPAVTLQTTAPLFGAIYAPASEVRSTVAATVFGAVMGDVVHLAGGTLHFDESLAAAQVSLDSLGGYPVVARWWTQ